MTIQGIVVINLIALALLLWTLNLVRQGRLYAGYGVMFIFIIASAMVTVSVPRLLHFVTALVGAVFPVSALTLIALGFIAFLFIYILTQLTIISDRLATLVQELAIRGVRNVYEDFAETEDGRQTNTNR